MLSRKLEVPIHNYMGQKYVSSRLFCAYVEIKQPFEFVRTLKKLSPNAVIKGKKTSFFRGEDENSRTTYIDIDSILDLFKNYNARMSFNKTYLQEALTEFKKEKEKIL